MMKKRIVSIVAISMVLGSSCKMDLLDNPNAVKIDNTNIDYLLNKIQLDYATHFDQMSDPAMRLTRMFNANAAIYDNLVTPGGRNAGWTTAYAGLLADVKSLIPLADKAQLYRHIGVARTIRASVLLNLVDAFGDVPYSAALNPEDFNPKVDKGADVYKAALTDLDSAVVALARTSKFPLASDLVFGGDIDKWARTANTLKLKARMNLRLTDAAGSKAAINALITENKLITAAAHNFAFPFGTSLTNPDTRHPRYALNYTPTGASGNEYMSNSYMGALYQGKGFQDPRIRYYFYRQTTANSTNINEIRCIGNSRPAHYSANDVFCYPTSVGYWGRDHLSNEGIPPDGLRKTTWGLYPAGGLYDNDAGRGVSLIAGAGGKGLQPFMMRSFTDFMLAEAVLTLGTTGDARALLKSGIEKSMEDVRTFALASTEASKIITFEAANTYNWATKVTEYVNKVLADYDAAATSDAKLNVIATEYWLAAHGNGIEIYNLYRRTGMPNNPQPALTTSPGGFIRSYYYPLAFIGRNSNVTQKTNGTVPVFWDNNPASLTK